DIVGQNIAAITAARAEAIRILDERGEENGEKMYQDAKKSPLATQGEEQINGEKSKLEEKIKQATEDAEKEWEKEYALISARNAIENIDEKSEITSKKAGEEPEAARAKTAYYLAAVEMDKLEVVRARLAASKEKDVNARTAAYNDAMDVQYAADSVQTQVSQPVNADGRGHVWIDEEAGRLIMGSNHNVAAVHFYLQDVATIGNAQTYGVGTRDTHTGMVFKETLQNPAGNPIGHWDVDHISHLSAADDDWTKRTYLRFRVDDEQGEHVDMLHLPDGREIPLAYIDFDKTEHSSKDGITIVLQDGNAVPADRRGRKFNLKRIAQAVQGNLTEVGQHEAAARLAAGEAIKKRLWLQAEEEVLQAARTMADLQELPETVPATAPRGTRSEYETAINEARDRFTAFANTAKNDVKNNLKRSDADPADGTRGDIDEKNAAWLEAAQRYAQGQKRIADATERAVKTAEDTARYLGEDVAKARQRATYVVEGLANLAQKSADGTNGDGFEAAATAAEKAAATEVAIAENKSTAVDHARHGEQLVGIEQEGTALRVAEGIEIGSTAAGNAVGTASVDASRTKAQNAARKYARLRGDANPDIIAETANQVINAKITAIETRIDTDITENEIPDEELRNEVRNVLKDMANARVAAQWALVEQEKLSAALAAQKCARVRNITAENTLRTEATNAINDVDQCVAEATVDKHPAEAGAAAVVAAKERRALFQAKAVTAQAEKTITRLTGGDDAAQTDAVHQILGEGLGGVAEGTIDAIYKQGGLVAVVRYAESRFQVKEAVERADQTARQMAAQRGLPELTPANVGDPTQATEGQAAARSVRDRAKAIRDRNEGNPNSQDIQSAEEVAPGAKQAITDAINQVQMTKDLARADHEITAQMNARTATAKRCAAAEAEIADLIMEAPDQETKREVFEATKEAAILFQVRAKAVKYTEDIQRAIEANDQARRTAVENAEQTLDDRYKNKKGGLAAAVRYAESLAQIAKAVRELGQADAQA
ncbi:MAG TPA: hypothetical protein VHV10_09695, partial [Ktedonobacteraceae bacterium]|nr:hypothetical protein [Ktedonobacteraceae bacterium]